MIVAVWRTHQYVWSAELDADLRSRFVIEARGVLLSTAFVVSSQPINGDIVRKRVSSAGARVIIDSGILERLGVETNERCH